MKLALIFVLLQMLQPHQIKNDAPQAILQNDIKEMAFIALKTKCNVCHATKKRTDLFTLENMDSLAPDIWKQVFVKKKMPKGNKIKLTEAESKALRDWIDITISVQN